MNKRIKDKIEEIEQYVGELTKIKPEDLEDYLKDFKTKAACERYAERIIEATVDLAFLSIKERKLPSPETDLEAFDILSEKNIIPPELAERLKDAKRMRNILAHKYGEVDDEIIFHAVQEELEKDVSSFIDAIEKKLK